MSTSATLVIDQLGRGARAFVVDCPWSTTRTEAPVETVAELGEAAISRVTLFRHGLECGRCDTRGLWARLKDAPIGREEARQVGAQLRRAAQRGWRN